VVELLRCSRTRHDPPFQCIGLRTAAQMRGEGPIWSCTKSRVATRCRNRIFGCKFPAFRFRSLQTYDWPMEVFKERSANHRTSRVLTFFSFSNPESRSNHSHFTPVSTPDSSRAQSQARFITLATMRRAKNQVRSKSETRKKADRGREDGGVRGEPERHKETRAA